MSYTIFEHRHKFAVWAAARAVQRGWKNAKVPKLKDAIERSGIKQFLEKPSCMDTTQKDFENIHRQWCGSIKKYLSSTGLDTSYGRVTKLVAIYIKSMVIVAGAEHTSLGMVAHPPIDRLLLQSLGSEFDLPTLRNLNWTQLDENDYYTLIDVLRCTVPNNQPFWMIEEYWPVSAS